ncbi:hypothetical protein [Streptomyces sp. NPDC047928]|uniref:hypothetical protein n=1 Tax=unclassified Streptomyces TaxID=2593676 RepID=UPI003721A70B
MPGMAYGGLLFVIASQRVTSDDALQSIPFLLMGGGVGLVLAGNFRGAADWLLAFTSAVMFGHIGSATTRTLRITGAVTFLLSLAGLVAQVAVLLRS